MLLMIYDEAFHTLRSACRVLFIGYSLPEADHDLRYLFRKAIRPSAEIRVILKEPAAEDAVQRYKQLFGLDDNCFSRKGFESFFEIQ